MTNFDRMLCNLNKETNAIKKVCEPLRSVLGVQYFCFCETSYDGVIFTLANNPELHEHFYATKSYLDSPFFHNPSLISPGIYSYEAIQDEKFQETLVVASQKLPLSFWGNFIVKNKTSLMRFDYAFDKSVGTKATDIVLNNLSIFHKFNHYFLNEMKIPLRNFVITRGIFAR